VPQVGYRETSYGAGWTVRPTGFARRIRASVDADRQLDRNGDLISRSVVPGILMDVRFNGFVVVRYADDRVRAGDVLFGRRQLSYVARFSPSRRVAHVVVDGAIGSDIDFANVRPGRGATVNASARINATDHLELDVLQNQRWLDVETASARGRVFTARVSRIRGTYTFTARAFARVIGQYVSTTRDPALYRDPVSSRSGTFSGTALVAYKINWQSVLFVGYGDERELSAVHELEPASRQFFVKLSYALQR
jgi:hypothetical protein